MTYRVVTDLQHTRFITCYNIRMYLYNYHIVTMLINGYGIYVATNNLFSQDVSRVVLLLGFSFLNN